MAKDAQRSQHPAPTSPSAPGARARLPWRLRVGISLALAALTLVVFAPVRHFGFLSWDDPSYVTQNRPVLDGLTWHGVAWAFTTGHASNWHPLTWLSHMLDVQMYGVSPGGHHVTSLLLHLVNALLLFGVLCRMMGRSTVWLCAFVEALLAVHPLHVESVT